MPRHARGPLDPSATDYVSNQVASTDGRTGASVGLMPRRQDPRPSRRDRDRELEVGGERAVLGEDRPAVDPDPHRLAPGGRYRLHPHHHSLLQPRAPSRPARGWNLPVLAPPPP